MLERSLLSVAAWACASLAVGVSGCGDDSGDGGGGGGATSSQTSSVTTTASSTSASGSTSSGGSGTCSGICTGAGFSGGTEEMFAGNIVECTCTGAGNGLDETTCDTYCAPFGVDAMNALLTTENSPNDKCVCDGTGG